MLRRKLFNAPLWPHWLVVFISFIMVGVNVWMVLENISVRTSLLLVVWILILGYWLIKLLKIFSREPAETQATEENGRAG